MELLRGADEFLQQLPQLWNSGCATDQDDVVDIVARHHLVFKYLRHRLHRPRKKVRRGVFELLSRDFHGPWQPVLVEAHYFRLEDGTQLDFRVFAGDQEARSVALVDAGNGARGLDNRSVRHQLQQQVCHPLVEVRTT
mmetsp:Transcript_41310/g.62428  ORF Transcript_41310/g.62428 Transcript_41310/m.62428 type:complete len:138 (+) Transcript_41310:658-1071(+)|eukprot:CAMPEP_0194758822 /NCGR_PEP_ID=MMETSP0323_2-20130528/12008_1 /TAXON_ID=2866 ORGANISM="Crypthecodinium cohnii, Strain Seligo" /NCGR_SAMPLE_ID=MMETSP0323_2 /ASSEMBLY_ACC=CAM_ASM_000346 /LENGTH=137 /DNA_ID=CAMNT_0039679289 /DNA_START=654 /DNA_END=1067 /DNA_ORIENTATION=-